jgi:hypothetical protein
MAAREARAAARLHHPGIVALHDRVIGDDGRPWLVMELVAGRSLDDVLRTDGPLPVRRVADIGRQTRRPATRWRSARTARRWPVVVRTAASTCGWDASLRLRQPQ